MRDINYFYDVAIRHYHREAGLESPWNAEMAELNKDIWDEELGSRPTVTAPNPEALTV